MSLVTVIYNPASGSAADDDELREAFREHEHGHRIRWSPTTEDDPGSGQTREAIASGSDVVIACGGDGTVRAVAEALGGSGVHLGVVPLGTGNLLAKNLDIPAGFDAIPTALSGSTKCLDVGTANGESFAVMAGTGFDALMIRDASPTVKHRLGSVAYVISALKNVRAGRTRVSVTVDGSHWFEGEVVMALAGNLGKISGGLEVFPDADPTDGLIDIAVLSPASIRDWLVVMTKLVRKRPQPDRLVKRASGRNIVIELARPTPWELDGEDRPPTSRLEIGVQPQSVEVRC